MTCKNCAVRVENALNRIDGVWATVDFPQNRALVRMKTPVDEEALRAAVWKSGYVAVRKNPPG